MWNSLPVLTLRSLVFSILVGGASGCSDDPAPMLETAADEGLRIVSLSPAISRTLVDFNLHTRVVGRTQFCWAIDPAVPVVGDVTSIAYERLIRQRPTHVLVQPSRTGVDPKLIELATERKWKLGVWSDLNGVEDIKRLIQELPGILFAPSSAGFKSASQRALQLLDALAVSLQPSRGKPLFTGRVLLLSGLEPVMAFGHGTYLHDMLRTFGSQNAVGSSGWVQLSMEDVVRLDPEAVLLVLDTPSTSAPTAAQALRGFRDLNIAAAREERLAVLAHRDSLLPSSGVIPMAYGMRTLLHELAEVPE